MTYSVVAWDREAGLMGVAVQSHHLAVGAHVVAAEPGCGVLAVQSFAHRGYAFKGLEQLRSGKSSREVLDFLRSEDPGGAGRAQVAVLSAAGEVVAHTGVVCIPEAGHLIGSGWSAQANMARSPAVWEAMAETIATGEDDLVDRLLAALQAAESAGGDWRGMQSAAIHVVSTDPSVVGPFVDLRVDDHPDPLTELRRLTRLQRGALTMSNAFEVAKGGEVDRAIEMLVDVQEAFGAENLEPTFWAGILLARAGRVVDAAAMIPKEDEGWIELVGRLPEARMLDGEAAVRLIESIGAS